MNGKKILNILAEQLVFIFGAGLYAFAFSYFIDSAQISPGGFTGIAAIINFLSGLPTGTLLFFLNIPVLILGYFKIGGRIIFKTLLITLYSSVLIDAFGNILPTFKGERLLSAIFGGLLLGTGLGVIMLKGGTTGGVDIIAKVIKRKFPFASMGRLLLILDGVVVLLATVVYKNIETALFTVILLFVSTKVVDIILYGGEESRLLFIVTDRADRVVNEIFKAVGRGATLIPATGGYKGSNKKAVLCAMRKSEVARAIKTIRKTDENAFTVVTLTGGVFGYGFERNVK